MAPTAAAPTKTPEKNRSEYEYTPIKARIYYRRAHPRAPVELVISDGAKCTIYEMSIEDLRIAARDTTALYFSSTSPPAKSPPG